MSLEEAEEAAVNASAQAASPESACSGHGFDPELLDSCTGDISMTGDYSYVDVYKAAQKMGDAAAKDRQSLERFDNLPVRNTTDDAAEPEDTVPSRDVGYKVNGRHWWQLLLP